MAFTTNKKFLGDFFFFFFFFFYLVNLKVFFFFFFFFFEMGKSKRVLVIFANSRNLACIEQEMTWIIGTSAE